MKRIALTDGSNKWFDIDKALSLPERTEWDGSNSISKATESQWNHEKLYYTVAGHWVLNRWSQIQGTNETYWELTNYEAAEWVIKNEYEDDEIPFDLGPSIRDVIASLEI